MENKYQIFVSTQAEEQITQQLIKRGTPNAFLRLGVKGAGCVGYSYVIEFAESAKDKDIIFTFNQISVLVDSKSILYLNGTTLDWHKSLIKAGFVFKNPNAKSSCSCGKSVEI